MSGHCKECFGVYGDHAKGCRQNVGRKPPRCCVRCEARPATWVLLDAPVATAMTKDQEAPGV